MKKLVLCGLLLVSFNATSGGIPVFDGVANSTTLQQWAEKLQQWQQTVMHYETQIGIANDQLKTLRGIKDHIKNFNINALIRDINAIDNLMPNYESIVNGNWNKDAERLAEKMGITEKCKFKQVELNNLCKSENMNLATNYIVADEINKRVNFITQQIHTLSREVATSNDVKTTADINNKIMVFNEQLETLDKKLSIARQQYEMNKELITAQRQIRINELNLAPTRDSFKYFERGFRNKNKRNSPDGF